jgi:DNA modification methylase
LKQASSGRSFFGGDDEDSDLSVDFNRYKGRQVSYYTHGIHRFPAKFIPQVPRFCMEHYSKQGDVVLDPFMGSGTTLLEAMLLGRDAYGIDIHPLARLIAKTKVTPLPIGQLDDTADKLLREIRRDDKSNSEFIPEMQNFDHWFRKDVARDLATIKKHIWDIPEGPMQDFFKICFSSIIRRVSNSDTDSLMPEVTSFKKKLVEQGKADFDALTRFENTTKLRILDFDNFSKELRKCQERYKRKTKVELIGNDARDIDLDDSEVDLAVTSPPYASAVHYMTVHKLEMHWLGMIPSDEDIEANIIGTARAYAEDYNRWEPDGLHPDVDCLAAKICAEDRKSGYTVYKYFADMKKNLEEVRRVLKRRGTYCMVAGENVLKGTRIPTYELLGKLAEDVGFDVKKVYDYDIINRHLDVPRWNNSTILQDHIVVLEK